VITSLSARNFKAWSDLPSLPLAPLTGLFGVNSAGKSSLIQILLLLKQTVESPDRAQVLHFGDDRSLVDLGTFSDIVHNHVEGASVEWSLSWDSAREIRVPDMDRTGRTLMRGKELSFTASVRSNGSNRPTLERFTYRFEGSDFAMARDQGSGRYKPQVRSEQIKLLRSVGRPHHLTTPVKCYGFPDAVRANYKNAGFLSDFELEFERLFARVYYLGPLRDYPQRMYAWGGGDPSDMGKRGENAIAAILAARDKGRYISPRYYGRRRSLEEHIAFWLKQVGLIDKFRVEELAPNTNTYRILVKRSPQSAEVLLTDVGFGVSQVLPVLALCFYVPEGSTVILEHPEIHLHPSAQAGLADMLIDAVKNRKVQIIVESHSEHFLRRIQRRIAEETLRAKDVALYFCDVANGQAAIRRLEVNLFGEVENWPPEFFGDEFGEIAATQFATARRKKAAVS
jgi:hypothetical protein